MSVTNILQKFSNIRSYWAPEVCGEIGNVYIKLMKAKGDFIWHDHESDDVLYYVVEGSLRLKFRESRDVVVDKGEMYLVAKHTEHLPTSEGETHVMIVEPKSISIKKGEAAFSQIFVPEVGL